MAWLTTYDATNYVEDSRSIRTEQISYAFGGLTVYKRSITDIIYRYVGMDYSTAITCANALASATVSCELIRENDGGAYTVRVSSSTVGAWGPA